MTRLWQVALLALAGLVTAFAATWLTIPSASGDAVRPPASLFSRGLASDRCVSEHHLRDGLHAAPIICVRYEGQAVRDVHALERRVLDIFGAAAVAVVIAGIAFREWRDDGPS